MLNIESMVPREDAQTIYVNGEWRGGEGHFPVHNPATGLIIGHAGSAGLGDVLDAVSAASRSAESWRRTAPSARSEVLRSVAGAIRGNVEQLAALLTAENGKPLRESVAEILGSAAILEWCAEEGRRSYGRVVPVGHGKQGIVTRAPIGIVFAISPWNFPASMLIRKIGLALAAGCTVITKPAEKTPLIATALVSLFHEAGLPAGVLNQLTNDTPAELVGQVLRQPEVAMVTFTGSTKVGRSLVANESGRLKRFSLELGGHAPGIVLAHSDVDRVVEAILVSKFRNAGQSCIALNRLFVHRSLYAEVIEKLVAAVRLLKVGNGMDPQTDIGPLIGQASAEKLEAQIQDAVAAGARILVGGNRSPHSDAESGTFFEPTVIADVPDSCALTRDEIFGPVLPVFQFDDVAEVIQRANDTSYGLASYVFGTDLREVTRVVEDLQFGVIGVNEPVPSALELPFGGEGDSGFGREGGSEGIGEFLTTKSILMAP